MTLRPRDVVYVFHFIAMKKVPSYIPALFVRCVTVAPTTNNRHNNNNIVFIIISVINYNDIDIINGQRRFELK